MAIWRTVVSIAHPSLGGSGSNTFHVRTDDLSLPIDRQGSIQQSSEALEQLYADMNALFPTATSISNNGEWYEVNSETPEALQTTPWTVGGAGGDNCAPPFVSLVIGWRTSLAARSGRGRTFLGPLATETIQDNGTPLEASRDAVQAAVDTFVGSFDLPLDGAFVIWSEADSVGRDIVSGSTRNEFAYLSSRRD
jgi:hypothetical protein